MSWYGPTGKTNSAVPCRQCPLPKMSSPGLVGHSKHPPSRDGTSVCPVAREREHPRRVGRERVRPEVRPDALALAADPHPSQHRGDEGGTVVGRPPVGVGAAGPEDRVPGRRRTLRRVPRATRDLGVRPTRLVQVVGIEPHVAGVQLARRRQLGRLHDRPGQAVGRAHGVQDRHVLRHRTARAPPTARTAAPRCTPRRAPPTLPVAWRESIDSSPSPSLGRRVVRRGVRSGLGLRRPVLGRRLCTAPPPPQPAHPPPAPRCPRPRRAPPEPPPTRRRYCATRGR